MVIGRAEVKNHMGRRALLTKTEREAIEDPDNAKYPYVAVSRVRKRYRKNYQRMFRFSQDTTKSFIRNLLKLFVVI